MYLPPLPPPPPTRGAGPSAHSGAVPSPVRGAEESDDSKATRTDYLLHRRQADEGEQMRARSPSVDSEDTMPLRRRPRVAARKQSENTAQQQGKSPLSFQSVLEE